MHCPAHCQCKHSLYFISINCDASRWRLGEPINLIKTSFFALSLGHRIKCFSAFDVIILKVYIILYSLHVVYKVEFRKRKNTTMPLKTMEYLNIKCFH